MGTVLSTVAGNPYPVLSLVPSATSLYCAEHSVALEALEEWIYPSRGFVPVEQGILSRLPGP